MFQVIRDWAKIYHSMEIFWCVFVLFFSLLYDCMHKKKKAKRSSSGSKISLGIYLKRQHKQYVSFFRNRSSFSFALSKGLGLFTTRCTHTVGKRERRKSVVEVENSEEKDKKRLTESLTYLCFFLAGSLVATDFLWKRVVFFFILLAV